MYLQIKIIIFKNMFKNIFQDKYFFTNITTLGWFVVLKLKGTEIEAIYTMLK